MVDKTRKEKQDKLDKNLKSLIDKGLVIQVGKGYKLSPLGLKLFGNKDIGKPNKLGGKIKKKYKKYS
jgi:hypothetical protein